MTVKQRDDLLRLLKNRFEQHPHRHPGLRWVELEARLMAQPDKLASLLEMENTGGEPDVVGRDPQTGAFIFFDCAPESPKGRRSLCYDQAARLARKQNRPDSSALEMATIMGIELLTEEQYQVLQQLGRFDTKTSSWLKTPEAIRKLGGAIFGDRRYDRVFIYHNGADSYYAARGFRGCLRV